MFLIPVWKKFASTKEKCEEHFECFFLALLALFSFAARSPFPSFTLFAPNFSVCLTVDGFRHNSDDVKTSLLCNKTALPKVNIFELKVLFNSFAMVFFRFLFTSFVFFSCFLVCACVYVCVLLLVPALHRCSFRFVGKCTHIYQMKSIVLFEPKLA